MRRRAAGLAVAAGLFLSGCPTTQSTSRPPEPAPHPFLPTNTKLPPATPPPAGPADTISIARSLYARLGHEEGITKIVDGLLSRAATDSRIAARFANANIPRIRWGLIAMIGEASGGTQQYKGADMKTAHAGMQITEAEFGALAEDLGAAMDALRYGKREKDELIGIVAATKKDIVERQLTVEERLLKVEQRLARLEAMARDGTLAAKPAAASPAASPKASPGKPGAPALADGRATTKFSAQEKELATKLVQRYGASAKTNTQGVRRDDLVGQKLAQTRFLSSTSDVIDLKDFEGKKKVVLVILRGFSGAVCIHCSTQTLALADAIEEFKKRNTEVILVYPGEADTVPGFLEAVKSLREGFAPPFPICLDVDLSAVRAFMIEGSLAKPSTLLIDETGTVRWAYVGRQPQDRPSAADILAAIDGLAKAPKK